MRTLLTFILLICATCAQAGRSFNGTTAYLQGGSAAATAEPITMTGWLLPTTTGTPYTVVSLSVNGGTSRFTLTANSGGFGASAISVTSGGTAASSSAGTQDSGAWRHYAATFASSTSRTAYFNGAAGTENTTSIVVSGLDRTLVGARISAGAAGVFASGAIADAAIWNAVLTADEIGSLAAGFTPRQVRPQSLVFYAPLLNGIQELSGGMVLTDTDTADSTDHPRIYASLPAPHRRAPIAAPAPRVLAILPPSRRLKLA